MKIGSVMSRDVRLIKPDDTIRSAAALMKKIDAGLLPVTEKCREAPLLFSAVNLRSLDPRARRCRRAACRGS